MFVVEHRKVDMADPDELTQIRLQQIRTKREAAARARRLADQFWSNDDRECALRFAEELEAQADELARIQGAALRAARPSGDASTGGICESLSLSLGVFRGQDSDPVER
jgi:hypothetical protein